MPEPREQDAPRVAVFFWEGYLSVAPSMVNGLRLMAQEGCAVDLFFRTPCGDYPPPPPFPPRVRLRECRPPSQWLRRRRFLWRAKRWRSLMLLADLAQFAIVAFLAACGGRYRAVVGVDMCGLIAASIAGRLRRSPVFYWSLEVLRMADMRTAPERWCKRLERRLSRRARLTIIQDAGRAATLAAENAMPPDRFIHVPNAPMALSRQDRSRFFHEKFGLPETQRVVLCIGMICDEALSRELAACAATWPGQYTLVLHERERRSPDEPYLRRIAELGGDRVRLSLEPVPLDELDRVTSAGDVGIALYRGDLGPNFSQMAAASGRLAYYLRSGLPVICPDLPGFREVVDGYRCGVCVQDAAAVGAALERIFDAYPIHRQNALRCFKERYDFARCFAPVLDAMLTRLPSHVGVGRHG